MKNINIKNCLIKGMKMKLFATISSIALLLIPAMELSAQESEQIALLQTRLAAVQHEAQLLEDERDIEILQRTYGYYVDKNLWLEIGGLFAEEGTLEIGGRGIFVGQDRAVEYLQWLGEPVQGRLYDHTQMQGIIHVSPDGKTAKGRWRALVFGGDVDRSSVFGDCIYENEYIKEDGVWKISKLHAYFIMYTMLEEGWETLAWPNTRPEEVLPPDLPPTVVYDMYPGELTAPYHYENPVTGQPVYVDSGFTPVLAQSINELSELGDIADTLGQRISRLADGQQIENLQNTFGYYFDNRQWDQITDLFAEDGTMERGQRGVYVGRDSIKASLTLYGESGIHQGNAHNNIFYQPVIHVADDGQTAQARLRTFNMHGDYEGEATMGGGVFENTYVKVDGVWQIQSDHLYTTFIAGYEGGWAHSSMPVPGISTELPPDLPPSFVYEAFPTYYTFPFHYNNPVTGVDPLARSE